MGGDPNRPATIVEVEARFDALTARQNYLDQRVATAESAHRDGQKEILDSLQRLTRVEQVPAALAGHAKHIDRRIGQLETNMSQRFDAIDDRLDAHETRLDALEDDRKLREGRGQMLRIFVSAAQWFAGNWLQILIGAGVLVLFAQRTVPAPVRERIEQTPLAAAALPDAITTTPDWALDIDPLRGR